jgi:hypothetical protein
MLPALAALVNDFQDRENAIYVTPREGARFYSGIRQKPGKISELFITRRYRAALVDGFSIPQKCYHATITNYDLCQPFDLARGSESASCLGR